jgi:rubrerythrin
MTAQRTTTQSFTVENRTGIARAPDLASEMTNASELFPPSSPGEGLEIGAVRVTYARELENLARYSDQVAETEPLLDKLGERLAFERAGTRLYEALLTKYEAYGSFSGGPSREDITHILSEELEHFELLKEAIRSLGGDPTELTPSANLQMTASQGVPKVLTDPRTTLVQSLECIAVAELTDNECWESLAELARLAGHDELAQQCDEALQTEQEHLEKVRGWLAAAQGRPPRERDSRHH